MNTKQIRNVDISGMQHLPMIDFIGNDFAIFDDIRDIPFTHFIIPQVDVQLAPAFPADGKAGSVQTRWIWRERLVQAEHQLAGL